MSTKHLFDDMYLYLKEIYVRHLNYKKVDPMNGLPKIDYTTKEPDYIEVTSKFWNLMHKSPTGA